MRVTLKDIALEAGVSVSTVSYALNKRGRVTKDKHKQIIEIANKYSYVPDANAKGLVTGINNNIGLLINKDTEAMLQQPFIIKCISEFSKYLRKYSGWLSLCMAGEMQVETMRHYLANANFDGIIFLFAEHSDDLADLLKTRRTPCVFFDSWTSGDNTADIGCDEEQGVKKSVDHLAALGHRKIMFLSAKNITWDGVSDIRQNVYRKALQTNHLEYEKIIYTGYDRQNVYNALHSTLGQANAPTAIVTPSDKIAWTVIDYLREHSIRVPEDISVVGFDDADTTENEKYGLTTVRQPVSDMVKASVDYIYECDEIKELRSMRARLEPTLIIRTSTGKCKVP